MEKICRFRTKSKEQLVVVWPRLAVMGFISSNKLHPTNAVVKHGIELSPYLKENYQQCVSRNTRKVFARMHSTVKRCNGEEVGVSGRHVLPP